MSDDQMPTYSTDYGLPWSTQEPQSSGGPWSPEDKKFLLVDLAMLAIAGLHCLLSIPFFCDSVQPGGPWVRVFAGVAPCVLFIVYSVVRVSNLGSRQPNTVHSERVQGAPVFVGCVALLAGIVQWFSTGSGLFLVIGAALSGPTAVPTRLTVHKLSGTSQDSNEQTAEVSLPGETSTFTVGVGEVKTPGRPHRPFDLNVQMRSGLIGQWFDRTTIKWVLDLYKFEDVAGVLQRTSQRAKSWKEKTLVFVIEPECPKNQDIELMRSLRAAVTGDRQALIGVYPADTSVHQKCGTNFDRGHVDDHVWVEFKDFLSAYLQRQTPQDMESFIFSTAGELIFAGPIADMPLLHSQ